MINFSG